jgi:predicted MFS family arabinose efflux permease
MAVLLQDKGIPAHLAAIGISVYAGAIIIGRVGCGFLLDRFSPASVAAIFTTIPAMGCIALITPEISFLFAAIAVAMAGLQQGSETDVMAYFISRNFGVASFSLVFGMVITAGVIGTVSGGILFGFTHDFTKSYDLALMASACLFMSAAILLWWAGPTKPGH